MANINEYLSWRGDIDLDISPFNDADNLILSQLAYIDFGEVVGDTPVTLNRATHALLDDKPNGAEAHGLMDAGKLNELLKKAAVSKRFRNIELIFPQSSIDEETQKQFYAVSFILGDGGIYIAFRGTDQTITGWQEDFNMAFTCPVPSQTAAVEYARLIASARDETLLLGGHSKGGNLAMYAAAFSGLGDRIKKVYNNDGPGFTAEIAERTEFTEISPKIISIIPQGSVVGMLFEHPEEHIIVKSTQKGLSQHDAFSWETRAVGFVELRSRNFESRLIDKTLTSWISSLDHEDRSMFVSVLFDTLSATGVKSVTELPADGFRLLKSFSGMSHETKSAIFKAIRDLQDKAIRSTFSEVAHNLRLPLAAEEQRTEDNS